MKKANKILSVFMVVAVCLFQGINGFIGNVFGINHYNDFYNVYTNTLPYNMLVGFLLGFTYMLFELPNSFIKRRLKIPAGKTVGGFLGVLFFVIDQIDSLIGVMLVLYIVSDITVGQYFLYVFVGGLTHIIINLILKLLKIRRNI